MKKLALILSVLSIAAGMSCNTNNNNDDENYMRCKLNGTLWQSTADNVGAIYNSGSGLVTFSGDDGTTIITANLAGITGTGTFTMGVGTASAMSVSSGGQFHYINVDFGSGTFYLDETKNGVSGNYDIEGRFEGVATNAAHDTIFITEGKIESF